MIDYLGLEIGLFLLLIILAIIIVPLIIGIGIALILELTGRYYVLTVILTAVIIWSILFGVWCI